MEVDRSWRCWEVLITFENLYYTARPPICGQRFSGHLSPSWFHFFQQLRDPLWKHGWGNKLAETTRKILTPFCSNFIWASSGLGKLWWGDWEGFVTLFFSYFAQLLLPTSEFVRSSLAVCWRWWASWFRGWDWLFWACAWTRLCKVDFVVLSGNVFLAWWRRRSRSSKEIWSIFSQVLSLERYGASERLVTSLCGLEAMNREP